MLLLTGTFLEFCLDGLDGFELIEFIESMLRDDLVRLIGGLPGLLLLRMSMLCIKMAKPVSPSMIMRQISPVKALN